MICMALQHQNITVSCRKKTATKLLSYMLLDVTHSEFLSQLQGRKHGWKVEGDRGLGPNTGRLRPAPRAPPKSGLGVKCVAPFRCEGPGVSPRKIFENSDAKSCILVTTCCEISCFWKLRPVSWGWGAIHCWSPT